MEPFKVVIPTVKQYRDIAEGELVIHPTAPKTIMIKPAKVLGDILWKVNSMRTDTDTFISLRGTLIEQPTGQHYIVVGAV